MEWRGGVGACVMRKMYIMFCLTGPRLETGRGGAIYFMTGTTHTPSSSSSLENPISEFARAFLVPIDSSFVVHAPRLFFQRSEYIPPPTPARDRPPKERARRRGSERVLLPVAVSPPLILFFKSETTTLTSPKKNTFKVRRRLSRGAFLSFFNILLLRDPTSTTPPHPLP